MLIWIFNEFYSNFTESEEKGYSTSFCAEDSSDHGPRWATYCTYSLIQQVGQKD